MRASVPELSRRREHAGKPHNSNHLRGIPAAPVLGFEWNPKMALN